MIDKVVYIILNSEYYEPECIVDVSIISFDDAKEKLLKDMRDECDRNKCDYTEISQEGDRWWLFNKYWRIFEINTQY